MYKTILDINCRPLTTEEARVVFGILRSVYITVEYDAPMDGPTVKSMICDDCPAAFMHTKSDGTELWKNISFQLTER